MTNGCMIRVTNQCNEKCEHCCFRSGPECVGQMSIETCEKINAWVPPESNLTIMGGEFSILDDYPEMLIALAHNRKAIRLITNGFWSHTDKRIKKFLLTMKQIVVICRQIEIGVSDDGWHRWSGDYALRLIKHNKLGIRPVPMANLSGNNVVPLGRAWDNKISTIPSDMCHCKAKWDIIITEDGMICLCPFGYFPWKHFSKTTWHDAQRHVWDWRLRQLAIGMNCYLCMETVEAARY